MIAVDNQPFSIVNDVGFKRLMDKGFPNYQIPSRKYFSEKVLDQTYDDCRRTIFNAIKSMTKCSFTSDIWTCSGTNESFISFSCHWLNENFELKHVVLNVKHFPGSHTGESICEMFQTLLKEWEIPAEKVHVLTTDNAATMKKGIFFKDFSFFY